MRFSFGMAFVENTDCARSAGYARMERLAAALADAAHVSIVSIERSSAPLPASLHIHVTLDVGDSDPACVAETFRIPGAHALGIRSVRSDSNA